MTNTKMLIKKTSLQISTLGISIISVSNKYLSRIGLRASRIEIAVLVIDTLIEYAEKKGFLEIEGNIVRLTKKGLVESQKFSRDWD